VEKCEALYLPLGIKLLKNVSVGTFPSERERCFTVTPPQRTKTVLSPLHTKFGLMELLSALKIRWPTDCFM
jgi:hypothetical protein